MKTKRVRAEKICRLARCSSDSALWRLKKLRNFARNKEARDAPDSHEKIMTLLAEKREEEGESPPVGLWITCVYRIAMSEYLKLDGSVSGPICRRPCGDARGDDKQPSLTPYRIMKNATRTRRRRRWRRQRGGRREEIIEIRLRFLLRSARATCAWGH
jgi:hypothetical protein